MPRLQSSYLAKFASSGAKNCNERTTEGSQSEVLLKPSVTLGPPTKRKTFDTHSVSERGTLPTLKDGDDSESGSRRASSACDFER